MVFKTMSPEKPVLTISLKMKILILCTDAMILDYVSRMFALNLLS